ncbi:MAG: alkaline phosphatase family protein [Aristaeellaceae bacterium]
MATERMVLYINWDGFAYDYYEKAHQRQLVPVLDGLRAQGVFFADARCGVPPITNPMQTAIASGVYAAGTGNVKLYYDREKDMVVGQRRENRAENMVQALRRQGISAASVHHFTFEDNGCSAGDPAYPFIFIEDSSYRQRFRELLRLYRGEKVALGGERRSVVRNPRFVAVYFDDLDTLGHNNGRLAPRGRCEEERVENVLWRLQQMDAALGEFLEGLKEWGIYDKMAIFLLTDHGMTPFSFGPQSQQAYEDLLATVRAFGLSCQVLGAQQRPLPDTDVVLCSAGLSMMLTCRTPRAQRLLEPLRECLACKPYIGRMETARELEEEGAFAFCDLYLSPKPPVILRASAMPVGANHDSLEETSRHIFAMAWGNGIRQGEVVSGRVFNIDFAPTMALLLQADPPAQCRGRILWPCLTEAARAAEIPYDKEASRWVPEE